MELSADVDKAESAVDHAWGFSFMRSYRLRIILPSFIELERNEAREDLRRCTLAIQREIDHLDSVCHDWAAWDDTTVSSSSVTHTQYIEANLLYYVFKHCRLNLIYIIDDADEVVWGRIYDLTSGRRISLPEFPEDSFPPKHPLISYGFQETSLEKIARKGILMTEMGPMLISSRPILQANHEGPIRGFFSWDVLLVKN